MHFIISILVCIKYYYFAYRLPIRRLCLVLCSSLALALLPSYVQHNSCVSTDQHRVRKSWISSPLPPVPNDEFVCAYVCVLYVCWIFLRLNPSRVVCCCCCCCCISNFVFDAHTTHSYLHRDSIFPPVQVRILVNVSGLPTNTQHPTPTTGRHVRFGWYTWNLMMGELWLVLSW